MTASTNRTFRVGITADAYDEAGRLQFADMGLGVLDSAPNVVYEPLSARTSVLDAHHLDRFHGVLVVTAQVTAESLVRSGNLLAFSRVGVGYDQVDIAACTASDVAVLIAAGAVDRSMAEATVGWMIALTHHMLVKDRMVRTGRWNRSQYMGRELRDRTFGAIGFGGIARATAQLLGTFGMKQPLAYDPYLDEGTAQTLGVRLVDLDTLLASSDFVSLHCPLNDETRGLVGARELAKMKPDSYLINTSRGGLVDEDALLDALAAGRISGAAIDCFAEEPVSHPERWSRLDNVLLAPHCLGWTDELFRDMGRAACLGIVDLAQGKRPRGVVNAEVFDRPGFQEKWGRLRIASSGDRNE